jgi:hypothetical protein
MRPLKILRLVFLFTEIFLLSDAFAASSSGRHESGPRSGGTARAGSARPASDPNATPTKPLPSRDELVNSAYLDASSILSEENACSRFFGGTDAALTVLTRLAAQLRRTRLAPGVGIRMYGHVTDFSDPSHGFSYRLFDKAVVNIDGPFSSRRSFSNEPPVRNIGGFQPDTREARVLMLLHEIGHLISGPDKNWLLPNDGGDDERSEKNTRLVESKCGEQIRALRNR